MIVILRKKFLCLLAAVILCIGAAGFSVHAAFSAGSAASVRLPVIMYHHISPKQKLQNAYTISDQQFEKDLIFLKNHGYHTVTLKEVIEFAENGIPLPEKAVMITFDDGFESFYAYAYPLLQKHEMHAVMFVTGTDIDKFTAADDHNLDYSYMTWDEVAELAASDWVEIGNHTYNMHKSNGSRLGCKIKKGENIETYKKLLTDDLQKTQDKILDTTGIESISFAYPFGGICKPAKEVLKEMGFKIAFSCEEKVNVIKPGDELNKVGRFNRANGKSSEAFFKNILDIDDPSPTPMDTKNSK